MFRTARVLGTAVFLSLALIGDSASAASLLWEQHAVSALNGSGAQPSRVSASGLQDNVPKTWNDEGQPRSENVFHWLAADHLDQFGLVFDPPMEGSTFAELHCSIALLRTDTTNSKDISLASHLLANVDSVEDIVPPTAPSLRFRQTAFPRKTSVSWVTKVEISVYALLAMLPFAPLGLSVFRWNQRRQKRIEPDDLPGIAKADLLMPQLTVGRPPGA